MGEKAAAMMARKLRDRRGRSRGIAFASDFLRMAHKCRDGKCGVFPEQLATEEQWQKALASDALTYTASNMRILEVSGGQLATKTAKKLAKTEGSQLDFEATVTTTRRDRHGDVLESMGGRLDAKAPLLWQHMPFQPNGKLVRQTLQNKSRINAHLAIIDRPFADDAAALVEFNALRISHGFSPTDWEELDEKDGVGFRVKEFDILEVSLVSVPANPDAEILDVLVERQSRRQFNSPQVKLFAQAIWNARPKSVVGGFDKDACTCGGVKAIENKANPHHHAKEDEDGGKWNKSLGKAFEASDIQLEPSSYFYDVAGKYLGVETKNIFRSPTFIPSPEMGSFLTGIKEVTSKFTLEDVRNIGYDRSESPPVYEIIQLNSKKTDDFLVCGTAFYQMPKGRLILSMRPTWGGIDVDVYSAIEDKKSARSVISGAHEWAKANNFLKGEAFSLSGEFIKKSSETWDDVFLSDKNIRAAKQASKVLNDKGKAAPNRGQIYAGPPGTGKTLSARVIMNTTEATLIWVSARDLRYCGSFGGLAYAFAMARELAPACLFIEDIDNWMTDYTVDLIKTEMDGIAKSTGLLTILSTNFPEHLPEALIDRPGRFHDVLYFSLPDAKCRAAMLAKWVGDLSKDVIADVVSKTNGYSGAHMYELAQFAKSIQETDELTVAASITEAIKKIDEQRETIAKLRKRRSAELATMTRGSGIGREVLTLFAPEKKSIEKKAKAGGMMAMMGKAKKSLQSAMNQHQEHMDGDVTDAGQKKIMADMKKTMGMMDDMEGMMMADEEAVDALCCRLIGLMLAGQSISPPILGALTEAVDEQKSIFQARCLEEFV